MAETALEQIEKRVSAKENVKTADINDAFAKTMKEREDSRAQRLEEFKKTNPDEAAFNLQETDFEVRAKNLQKKLLGETAQLEYEHKAKESEEKNKERDNRRATSLANALAYGRTQTDPSRKGNEIDDYEGVDYSKLPWWGEKNDSFGYGRLSLSGYMAAMTKIGERGLADAAWKKATDAYKTTDKWHKDAHLSDENITNIIGGEYLALVPANGKLTDEAKAFLAGYLHNAADRFGGKDKENFKKYQEDFVAQFDEIAKNPDALDYKGPKKEPWEIRDELGKKQINAFLTILDPREWQERWKSKLTDGLNEIKSFCDTFTAAKDSDFQFKDTLVLKYLQKKNIDELEYTDVIFNEMNSALGKARDEVFAYMGNKKTELSGTIDANKDKLKNLKERNAKMRTPAVTEDQWKAMEAGLDQQKKDLDAVEFVPGTSAADFKSLREKLSSVRSTNETSKGKLDEYEAKIKDGEEKEPFIKHFIDEKHLAEKRDSQGKYYIYSLDAPSRKIEKGKLVMSFNNPEVKKIFEDKASALIKQIVSNKTFTNAEKNELDRILSQTGKTQEENLTEAEDYLLKQVQATIDTDNVVRLQTIMRIIDAAIKESSYNFDHAPTLEELKQGYDSTFVKAWEKAAKALDTDIKPFEKSTPATTAPGKGPSRGVGSGFLGGKIGKAPSKERGPAYKDYGERWETGAPAPLTKDFKGYTGGLHVAPGITGINFRHESNPKSYIRLPAGTGLGSNEITLSDTETGWKIDNTLFLKVNYKGAKYFVSANYIQRNETSSAKPTPAPTDKKETKSSVELPGIGTVHPEYRAALEAMWAGRENPSGVPFVLKHNKQDLLCVFKKTGDSKYPWSILWNVPGGGQGEMTFKSDGDALIGLNDGYLLRRITWDQLRDRKSFEKYENIFGAVQNHEMLGPERKELAVNIELDWHGGGFFDKGNPTITVMSLEHGHIRWIINRTNAGAEGQDSREGYALSFDDFARQMAHIKEWNEAYDASDMNSLKIEKEKLYAKLYEPDTFSVAEEAIGRRISNDIQPNGAVRMFFDWGGGQSLDESKNAMLNAWIEKDGKVHYYLHFDKLHRTGAVDSVEELINFVAQQKSTFPEAKKA